MGEILHWWRNKALHSPRIDIRLRTIERLVESKDRGAINLLIEALADEDNEVRAGAAIALAHRGDPRAIRPLAEAALRERELEVAQEITSALATFDESQTVTALRSALDDHDVKIRQAAASTLRKVAWNALDDLHKARVAILQSDWATVSTLGPGAIAPLKAALIEGTIQSKREAARILGEFGVQESFDALVSVLDDGACDDATRKMAAWALRSCCWTCIEDGHLARIAILLDEWSLAVNLGAGAVRPLMEALQEPTTRVRECAAEALGRIANDEAVEAIAAALRDENQDVRVREVAARILGRVEGTKAGDALVCGLGDPAWQVRVATAQALDKKSWQPPNATALASLAIARKDWSRARSAGVAAIAPLKEALHYQAVATDAAKVLIDLGTPGIDALVQVLKDANEDAAVREMVATMLAGIQDPRAVEPLRCMLSDADMAVRFSAVWALERLGWTPTDDPQRALVAIVNGDWEQVMRLGVAALEHLLRMSADGLAPRETADALRNILESMAGRISIAHLRKLAKTEDVVAQVPSGSSAEAMETVRVDCGAIRNAAKREMFRRGLVF